MNIFKTISTINLDYIELHVRNEIAIILVTTRRNYRIRFKEHLQALKSRNNTTKKSNCAKQIMNSQHKYTNWEEN